MAEPEDLVLPPLDSESISALLLSHEKALFGYPNRAAMQYIPGLLQQRAEDHKALLEVKEDVKTIKTEIKGVPEMLELVKSIRRWGIAAVGAYFLWQVASFFPAVLKNAIPDIIRAFIPHNS